MSGEPTTAELVAQARDRATTTPGEVAWRLSTPDLLTALADRCERLARLEVVGEVGEVLEATERGITVERLPAPKMDGTYWMAFDRSHRGRVFFGDTPLAAIAALAEVLREENR